MHVHALYVAYLIVGTNAKVALVLLTAKEAAAVLRLEQ
jgi:hypothetical protein